MGTLPLLSGCGSPAANQPSGPAEAMQNLMQGVSDQKLEVVWNFLPPSYQSDVNGLAHQFADKMDPEIYNEMFGIAQRIAKLLQDKREYVLKNEMLANPQTSPEEAAKYYGPSVDILATLANSDLSSIEKLKTFDGGKFLSTSGSQIAKDVVTISDLTPGEEGKPGFMEKLKQAKVTLVSEEGKQATIKIEVPGEKTQEETMVKVEDKWIPKTLADNWKSKIESAKKKLDSLNPESISANKTRALEGFKKLNEILAQLENAKTEKEFNEKLTQEVRPVAQMLPMLMMVGAAALVENGFSDAMAGRGAPMKVSPGAMESTPVSPTGKPKMNMATVRFSRKLSFEEQDPFVKEVAPIAKEAGAKRVLPGSESGLTVIRISPMPDFEKFSAGMQKNFKAADISKIDNETNTITVEVP